MRRITATIILSLFFLSLLHAAPVDRERAERVAVNWMLTNGGGEYTALTVEAVFPFSRDGLPTHYIVNLLPAGVVIVAGDDVAWPVLMYGANGRYDGSFLPPAVADMLDRYADDLRTVISEGLPQPAHVAEMWRELEADRGTHGFSKGGGGSSIASVSPLISATWNQTFPYNQDCPTTSTGGSGGHVYVGCVATAMAMVMHYWQHPTTGVGSHSYNHPTYGTQSADFGNTTYSWSSMPNSVNSNSSSTAKAEIARISYHCGVSVEMDYSPTGSGATTSDARSALVNHFRYKSTASHRWRSNYSTSNWVALLTGELDNGRPVIYRGSQQNGSGGHAFIVDGYSGSDYFHMNFGWGGYLDGYFYLNDITPGSNTFTYYQGMITGIEPVPNTPPTLSSPAHQSSAVCVTPTLSWGSVSGATSYRLQVSTSSTFGSTVYDNAALTATSATINGLGRGITYYWRANVTSSAGTSAWSTVWSFTTRAVTVAAAGPTVFCEGGSVQLDGSAAAGASYAWSKNGTSIPGATQSSYVATESGSYVLSVIDNGCPTPSDPVAVIVNSIPDAEITAMSGTDICHGESVALEALQTSGASYQWRKNGGDIPGATSSTFSATESGSYEVYVEHSGCGRISMPLSVVVHPADPDNFVWTGTVNDDWSTTGNWDSPCAIPNAGDDVTIPSGVTPPASIPALTLGNLTINNAAGVALGGSLVVSGIIDLQNGNLSLGDYDLVIESTGGISGASGTRRIITDGTGVLRQLDIGTGGRTGAVLFPVAADAGSYTPVTITNATAGNSFAVRVSEKVLAGGGSGTAISSGVVDRTWHIGSGSGQTNASLLFAWTAGEELQGFDRTQCFVSRNDAGFSWDAMQQPAAAQGSGLITRLVSGVTTISSMGIPFAVGSGGTLYPVEFLSFSATVEDGHAILQWTTVNEVNNYGFRIEKRHGSRHEWSSAGFVPAGDVTAERHSYAWRDETSLAAPAEYRLAQIDLDGSVQHSSILSVGASPEASLLLGAVHPHPLHDGITAGITLTAGLDADARITLHDALGRAVRTLFDGGVRSGSSRAITITSDGLPPGLYFLRLESALGTQLRRFMIAR